MNPERGSQRPASSSTEDLVESYFFDHFGQEAHEELEQRMLADPEVRAAFHRAASLDAGLRTVALNQRLHARVAPSRRRALALVATGVLLLAGSLVWMFQRREAPVAHIVEVSGTAVIRYQEERRPVAVGDALPNGGELFCGVDGGRTMFRLRDGSRFWATPGTRVRVSRVDGQYRLDLSSGVIEADVEKQPPGKHLLISTAGSTVKVLGTRLTLYGGGHSSKVIVEHGQVEMIRHSDREVLMIGDEESAQVVPGVAFSVIDISGLETRTIEILRARYGADSDWVDVTGALRARVQHSRLIPVGKFNTLAGDPVENRPKVLEVTFRVDGQEGTRRYPEYLDYPKRWYATDIILPLPGVPDFDGAQWVWDADAGMNAGQWRFRKTLDLPAGQMPGRAEILLTCDNNWVLFINGEPVGRSALTVDDAHGESVWQSPGLMNISDFLRPGPNEVTIDGTNRLGTKYAEPTPAGLLAKIRVIPSDGGPAREWVTDAGWESASLDESGQLDPRAEWQPVLVLGDHGIHPWGSLDAAFRLSNPGPGTLSR